MTSKYTDKPDGGVEEEEKEEVEEEEEEPTGEDWIEVGKRSSLNVRPSKRPCHGGA